MNGNQKDGNKEIVRLVATYTSNDQRKPETREVEIQGVHDGKAFIQPTSFDPWNDEAIYYHGWETNIENISNVYAVRADGTRELLGDPPVNKTAYTIPIEIITNVL